MADTQEENTTYDKVTSIIPTEDIVSSIRDYRIGATLPDGTTIDKIYLKKPDSHIIYSTKEGNSYSYRYSNLPDPTLASIRRFESIRAEANKKLKNTSDPTLMTLGVTTLKAVFQEPHNKHDEVLQNFQNYVNDIKPVRAVLGRGKGFAVWLNHNGIVQYQCDKDFPDIYHSLSEYTKIKALAAALLPQTHQELFQRRLGAALVAAFNLKPGKEINDLFSPLDSYIQKSISNKLRIRYLSTTSVVTTLLILLSYVSSETLNLPQFLHMALIPISGGFLGTFLSVFERSKTLSIDDNESTNLIILQGTLRVLLGGAFGLIAYSAVNSGLAFNMFNETVAALILLGVAAGFSERLIPDLVQSFSPNNKV